MVSREYVKGDLPEKAAILQRDGETYAIAPHIPGGIVYPETLRRIADIAEKYGAAALKLTSAQRIAIVGLKEEDLDAAWGELNLKPGAAIGLCVRSIKICPGTTFCKRGKQDAVGLGLKLDKKYHGMQLPSKFKMAVSGCQNSCSEPMIKDIGLMGTAKGFTLSVGGSAGPRPRLGNVVAKDLTEEQAMDLIERIINFYKGYPKQRRIGEVIDEMGLEKFKAEVGLL